MSISLIDRAVWDNFPDAPKEPLPRVPKIEKEKIVYTRPKEVGWDNILGRFEIRPSRHWFRDVAGPDDSFCGYISEEEIVVLVDACRMVVRTREGKERTLWDGQRVQEWFSSHSATTCGGYFCFCRLPGDRLAITHPEPDGSPKARFRLSIHDLDLRCLDSVPLPVPNPKPRPDHYPPDPRFLPSFLAAACAGQALVVADNDTLLLFAVEPKLHCIGKGTYPSSGSLHADGDRILSSSDTSFEKVNYSWLSNLDDLLEADRAKR